MARIEYVRVITGLPSVKGSACNVRLTDNDNHVYALDLVERLTGLPRPAAGKVTSVFFDFISVVTCLAY